MLIDTLAPGTSGVKLPHIDIGCAHNLLSKSVFDRLPAVMKEPRYYHHIGG